jgi:hypothetical protein
LKTICSLINAERHRVGTFAGEEDGPQEVTALQRALGGPFEAPPRSMKIRSATASATFTIARRSPW